ncbi:MAG: hypothetical protein KAV42_00200 [Candidatus Krumholzibacteria bacterium]|nr:hypothetical protein [Candidatus Krumholzibacteria bacterium]
MDCHLFKMLIQRYHDGELDRAGMAEYEEHRRNCQLCERLDTAFDGIFSALGDMEVMEPSSDFNMKVMARVDVSRYKVRAARKVWLSARGFWRGLPVPLQATGIISSVFVLFIAIYTPFLLMMVSAGKKLLGMTESGLYVIRRLFDDPQRILNYISSVEKYRVAGKILVKTMQRQVAGIPLTHFAMMAIAAMVILYVVFRTAQGSWKKGETHVSIF